MVAATMDSAAISTIMDLSALLNDGIRFGTIFADPSWLEQGGGRIKRGADRHYPLMKTAAIVATGDVVKQLVKKDSHLYLWTTNNHLLDALEVMEAWGFRYVTLMTWLAADRCLPEARAPRTTSS
jgi:N6-adenosine-specific RNA methylase IME4